MSEPSGVRTRLQRQREPGEEQAEPEMATSAAEQFEGRGSRLLVATMRLFSRSHRHPGAEAPTTTSEEDKMQTLMRLLMNMNQTMNQKLDQQAQTQAQQAQTQPQQMQKLDFKLDQQVQAQAQQTQKLDLKLDTSISKPRRKPSKPRP